MVEGAVYSQSDLLGNINVEPVLKDHLASHTKVIP